METFFSSRLGVRKEAIGIKNWCHQLSFGYIQLHETASRQPGSLEMARWPKANGPSTPILSALRALGVLGGKVRFFRWP
jgi:hypothetical protein